MSEALWKDTLREIKRSFNRFISILLIIALGVGFFVGIKCASPSMLATADYYFHSQQLMDFKLQSTVGFDTDDLESIANTDKIAGIMPAYSADVILRQENKSTTVKMMSISPKESPYQNLNQPVLIEGRLPESSNECVVDHTQTMNGIIEIGSTIQLEPTVGEQNLSEILASDIYTVVGIVESPMFITYDRGKSTIGDGFIDCFFMIPQENFKSQRYTEVYVQTNMSKQGISTYSSEYKNSIQEITTELEKLGNERVIHFEQTILQDARIQLEQAKQDYQNGQQEADIQLKQAKQQLEDGLVEIQRGEAKLSNGEQQLHEGTQIANENFTLAEQRLKNAQEQLEQGKRALEQSKQQLAQSEQQIRQGQSQLVQGEKQLQEAWQQYDTGLAQWKHSQQLLQNATAQLEQTEQIYETMIANGTLNAPDQQLEFARTVSAMLTAMVLFIQNNQSDTTDIVELQSIKNEFDQRIQKVENTVVQGQPIPPLFSNSELLFITAFFSTYFSKAETALQDAAIQLRQGEEQLAQTKTQLDRQQAEFDRSQQELTAGFLQLAIAQQAALDAENTLRTGQAEYETGLSTLQNQQAQYQTQYANGIAALQTSRNQLEQAKADLAAGEIDYDQAVAEATHTLEDARQQIDDAQKQLDQFSEIKWYVFQRDDNPGYSSFESDTQRVDAVATVFPFFFILVVILVTLTTMTRMVEDQRIQIGTLKALGYSSSAIAGKYFLYSLFAGAIGCILGLSIGIFLFPSLIFMAYGAMYPSLPSLIYSVPWLYPLLSILVAIICTSAVTIIACYNSLRVSPSILMRPKAPKPGKRILLERINLIWKYCSFTSKVTARNLFRYKIRFLMTLLGVAGCTALIITAFGLNDSVSVIAQKQFVDIIHYNTTIVFDKEKSADEAEQMKVYLNQNTHTQKNLFVSMQSAVVYNQDDSINIETYLLLPESTSDFSSYIELRNRTTEKKLELQDEGVIITEKISIKLGLKEGDLLTFRIDDKDYAAPITGITENYANHYIYMSPKIYEEIFHKPVAYTNALSIVPNLNDEIKSEIASDLLKRDDIITLSYNDAFIEQFNDTIKSMQAIVAVIILTAGALAFVVLYNLTNINIEERVREIATIKVLGFYTKETISYVFRENIILTLLGIAVGIGLGTWMSSFVVNIIELDTIMFGRGINWVSYLSSVLITFAFAALVMVFMSFKIRKINMIESLKSNE